MRGRLIRYWLCAAMILPVLHVAFGRRLLALDAAGDAASVARSAEASGDWAAAERAYRRAAESMPAGVADRAIRLRLRLAVERARARNGQIVDASARTAALLDEAGALRDASLTAAVRGELGTMRFYTAWLMRRQAAAKVSWTALAESARQDFRYLADTSSPAAEAARGNLQRVVDFERAADESVRDEPYPEPALASNADVAERYDEQQQAEPRSPGGNRDGRQGMNLDQPANSAGRRQPPRRTGS